MVNENCGHKLMSHRHLLRVSIRQRTGLHSEFIMYALNAEYVFYDNHAYGENDAMVLNKHY